MFYLFLNYFKKIKSFNDQQKMSLRTIFISDDFSSPLNKNEEIFLQKIYDLLAFDALKERPLTEKSYFMSYTTYFFKVAVLHLIMPNPTLSMENKISTVLAQYGHFHDKFIMELFCTETKKGTVCKEKFSSIEKFTLHQYQVHGIKKYRCFAQGCSDQVSFDKQ